MAITLTFAHDKPPPLDARALWSVRRVSTSHPVFSLTTHTHATPVVEGSDDSSLELSNPARAPTTQPGMQPPNPRAPSTTAPHLRSARVVVVGPAASPAASAPIGIGALAAAGARGRRLQNLPRRELSSFLNFGMTKKAQNDDASHNVAWRTLL